MLSFLMISLFWRYLDTHSYYFRRASAAVAPFNLRPYLIHPDTLFFCSCNYIKYPL